MKLNKIFKGLSALVLVGTLLLPTTLSVSAETGGPDKANSFYSEWYAWLNDGAKNIYYDGIRLAATVTPKIYFKWYEDVSGNWDATPQSYAIDAYGATVSNPTASWSKVSGRAYTWSRAFTASGDNSTTITQSMTVSEAQQFSNKTGVEIKVVSGPGISNETELMSSDSTSETVQISYTLDTSFTITGVASTTVTGPEEGTTSVSW